MLVEAELKQLIINENSQQQMIVLKESQGQRTLTILVGIPEILSIDRSVKRHKAHRPMTHDLYMNTLVAFGAKISRVIINSHHSGVYFALIELLKDDEILSLDARPSDAISLALKQGVAIFIDDALFLEG